MKSNKKVIDDSTISVEEKKSNAGNKSTGNLNSTKKTFPSSQRNFKPKTTDKESISNEEIAQSRGQNNNMNVK